MAWRSAIISGTTFAASASMRARRSTGLAAALAAASDNGRRARTANGKRRARYTGPPRRRRLRTSADPTPARTCADAASLLAEPGQRPPRRLRDHGIGIAREAFDEGQRAEVARRAERV